MNLEKQVQTNVKNDLLEANIRMIGDTSTIADIVKLVAFIRHAILNKQQTTIQVEVGTRVNSDFFGFLVNSSEIRDYLPTPSILIN